MKKAKALARSAQAQQAQADTVARVEAKLDLIMQHLGITPLAEPEFFDGVGTVELDTETPSDVQGVIEEFSLDDVSEEVVEETTSKRKK